jgi:hypothetical protein
MHAECTHSRHSVMFVRDGVRLLERSRLPLQV